MKPFPDYSQIKFQPLSSVWLSSKEIEIAVLRLDRLHPEISGNKWFKLKYNLEEAEKQKKSTILTFGGAWSNHIAATAAACNLQGFKSIGIIRGEQLLTPTLVEAKAKGMQPHFISREAYRRKDDEGFIRQLVHEFDDPYIIPEGGDNALGIKGCKEILAGVNQHEFSHLCCAVGTGTTLAGLIEIADPGIRIIGFPALKNAKYLIDKIRGDLSKNNESKSWQLNMDYHFGGFAKATPALTIFIHHFYDQYHIPLDFIYTGKMMYGTMDLVKNNYFPSGSRILAIHTGGLQGNRSLPETYKYLSQGN